MAQIIHLDISAVNASLTALAGSYIIHSCQIDGSSPQKRPVFGNELLHVETDRAAYTY
jgi:hypothetical protein